MNEDERVHSARPSRLKTQNKEHLSYRKNGELCNKVERKKNRKRRLFLRLQKQVNRTSILECIPECENTQPDMDHGSKPDMEHRPQPKYEHEHLTHTIYTDFDWDEVSYPSPVRRFWNFRFWWEKKVSWSNPPPKKKTDKIPTKITQVLEQDNFWVNSAKENKTTRIQ